METPATATTTPAPVPAPVPAPAAAPVPLTAVPAEATAAAPEEKRTKRKYTKRAVKADAPKAKRKYTKREAKAPKAEKKPKRVAGTKAQGQVPKPVMKFLKSLAKEKDVTVGQLVGTAVTKFAKSQGLELDA